MFACQRLWQLLRCERVGTPCCQEDSSEFAVCSIALQGLESIFCNLCGVSGIHATSPLHAHVRLLRCRAVRADSERLSDSQRRLSIIRETPDKATLEAPSPAEGRVKGAGAALSSLGQKESSSENSSLRQKIQNGILKGA